MRLHGLLAAAVVLVSGTAVGCSDGSITVEEPVALVCGAADLSPGTSSLLYSIHLTRDLPPETISARADGDFELVALDAGGIKLDAVPFDLPDNPPPFGGSSGGDPVAERRFCVALRAELPGLARVQVRTQSRVDTDAVFTGELQRGKERRFALQVDGVRVVELLGERVSFHAQGRGRNLDANAEVSVSYRTSDSGQWVKMPAEVHWMTASGNATVPAAVLAQEFQLRVQVRSGNMEVTAESPLAHVE